jgi:rod shape-determining protein MreD
VRKLLFAVPLLVVGLLLQLTVLNGLQLPGGGVPDLMLVLVAAIALSSGPVTGMVLGFAAGLAVDLAPPGSLVIGQYALAFCLVGWAAGRLRATAARSAVRSVLMLAVVIVIAECFIAGVARALGQVTVTQASHVVPYTIVYDLLICPFVLYLVLLISAWLDNGEVAGQPAGGLPPGPGRLLARRAQRKGQPPQPHQPQLRRAAARSSDGWISAGPRALPHQHAPSLAARRLRPGTGVAGSASGYARHAPALSVPPVRIRLSGGRRGDGNVASAPGGPRLAGRHPGMLAGAGTRAFRPQPGLRGGSAAASYAAPAPVRRPSSPKFRGYRGDAGTTGALSAAGGNGTRRLTTTPKLRLAASRSQGSRPARSKAVPKLRFGSAPSPALSPARSKAVPKLRFGSAPSPALSPARQAAVPKLRLNGTSPAIAPGRLVSTPKLDFRTRQRGPSRHRPAEPKFHGHSGVRRPSAIGTSATGSGVLDQQTFRAIRRKAPRRRLKLGQSRNGSGMLGGTGRQVTSPHGQASAVPRFRARRAGRRPSGHSAKSPKFGYGRRSVLSFLVGKRIGGKWLARRRAGSRSSVWMISRRPGGSA